MAAPNPPSVHGPFRISSDSAQGDVWGGRFTFTTAGGLGAQQASITDANFTSRIVRSNNHIILTAGNGTASRLVAGFSVTTSPHRAGAWAQMTNNATIIVNYDNYLNGVDPMFFFMIFAGGTVT